jgi:hypothetical protein
MIETQEASQNMTYDEWRKWYAGLSVAVPEALRRRRVRFMDWRTEVRPFAPHRLSLCRFELTVSPWHRLEIWVYPWCLSIWINGRRRSFQLMLGYLVSYDVATDGSP